MFVFCSRSWESLRKVRRYHFHASNSSEKKGLGHISILELSSTTFGFMGYALTRPKMFGIKHSDPQALESYLHFWAVVGHALGVEDKFNMCLFPVEVVIQICEIMRRYIFIPLLQVEQPLFKSMVTALVKGYADYVPMLSYPSLIFETRRITGIPGYQLNPICMDETICKPIYTKDELDHIRSALKKYSGFYDEDICFTEQIPLIEVKRLTNSAGELHQKLDDNKMSLENSLEHRLEKYLDLQPDEKVSVTFLNSAEWLEQMNDSKLKLMSKYDKFATILRCKALTNNEKPFFRYLNEMSLNISLFRMKRQQK
jgi:ER-bound oxygenase mpaB/B'/Rubber oxygenase, catalytic domain